MPEENIIQNLSSHYVIRVFSEFDEIVKAHSSISSMQLIGETLIELYRYFEPAYFESECIIIKHFNDDFVLPKDRGIVLYDMEILLDRKRGDFVLQILDDETIWIWEEEIDEDIFASSEYLVYRFNNNKEYFYANETEIEITKDSAGSQFKPDFANLYKELNHYANDKIKFSSCKIFNESWYDEKRIFFKGGEKDVPEIYMQDSLSEYLKSRLRGINVTITREHNTGGAKPVDIKIEWKESNRIALIEVKWLGKSKDDDDIKSKHYNGQANSGALQLKGYHDATKQDIPNSILRSYLVVIDGRRYGTSKTTKSISKKYGLWYEEEELSFAEDRLYHEDYVDFEIPVRMFAEPVCD